MAKKQYKKPIYVIEGKKYTLKDYGELKLSETKVIDSLLNITQNTDNQIKIDTSSPIDITNLILISADNPDKPIKINYDNMTLNEMMEFTAKIVVDFILERDHFLACLPERMQSLGKRKAKQRLNI